jgi:penicillin-binding protein 2
MYNNSEQFDRNFKSSFLTIIIGILFSLLIARLIFVQVVDHEENFRLSENNRMRQNIIKAPRGEIEDRHGNVLVRNRPSYHISLLYHKMENKDSLIRRVLSIEDSEGNPVFDSLHLLHQIKRGRWRKYKPQLLYEDAPFELVSIIEERSADLPGIITEVESRRAYPYGTLAAHTLGYTGRITVDQLKKRKDLGYDKNDRLGKKGLENHYEATFKGVDGVEYIEVDAFGRRLGQLDGMPKLDPIEGKKVITTLDLELQKIAENAFPDSLKGGLVAIDPSNGEVLAMVSSPRMNPNIFSLDSISRKREWANVALDSDAPLNNRALVGLYPPGSLFKFFTAIAGMQQGIHPKAKPYKPCHGGYQLGRRYQKCWKLTGHGNVDMIEALKTSCDVYFYQLGLQIDMDPINNVARMFGLEKKTHIDLPIEKRGVLIDSVTYNRRNKRLGWRWTRGQILHLSIGQGQLVTPLQMANAFAGLGNGYQLFKPRLIKAIIGADGRVESYSKPEVLKELSLTDSIRYMVNTALNAVVNEPGGTGRRARVKGVRVGGKTGSAENPHGELTHAWFGAVAPLEKPEIAIAVVVENAGHGGSVAAPIASQVLNYFFERKNQNVQLKK